MGYVYALAETLYIFIVTVFLCFSISGSLFYVGPRVYSEAIWVYSNTAPAQLARKTELCNVVPAASSQLSIYREAPQRMLAIALPLVLIRRSNVQPMDRWGFHSSVGRSVTSRCPTDPWTRKLKLKRKRKHSIIGFLFRGATSTWPLQEF